MSKGRARKSEGAAPATSRQKENGANLGFEAQLFLAADKLRKNLGRRTTNMSRSA